MWPDGNAGVGINLMYGAPSMNMAGTDPDMYAQLKADQNRQIITQLLMSRGIQQPQGQMAGRFYVPPSPLQHANSLASLGLGMYGMAKGDQDRAAAMQTLKERRQQELANAIGQMSKDLAPTKPGTMPIEATRAEMPDTWDVDALQGGPQVGTQALPNNQTRAHAAMAVPIVDRGGMQPTSQTIAAQVPKSKEEIMAARMQYLTHQRPELREAMKFQLQHEQQDEQNALNRESRVAESKARIDQMLMMKLITDEQANKMKADLETKLHQMDIQGRKDVAQITAASKLDAQANKPPAGYRFTKQGDLEAIPGGPADTKLQGAFNQDTAVLQNSTSNMDRLATAANQLMQHKGLAGITGIQGAFPNIPGGSAADAEALLGTLKSQIAFGVLQEMRNNSKTGGALGAVSDAEGKRLESNLAALDKAQSIDQMKQSLQAIIDYTDQAKGRFREAFNMKHKGAEATTPSGAASSGAPKVRKYNPATGKIE